MELRIKVCYFWEIVAQNVGAWESEIAQNIQNNDKLHISCFQNKEFLNIQTVPKITIIF